MAEGRKRARFASFAYVSIGGLALGHPQVVVVGPSRQLYSLHTRTLSSNSGDGEFHRLLLEGESQAYHFALPP